MYIVELSSDFRTIICNYSICHMSNYIVKSKFLTLAFLAGELERTREEKEQSSELLWDRNILRYLFCRFATENPLWLIFEYSAYLSSLLICFPSVLPANSAWKHRFNNEGFGTTLPLKEKLKNHEWKFQLICIMNEYSIVLMYMRVLSHEKISNYLLNKAEMNTTTSLHREDAWEFSMWPWSIS